MHHLSLLLRRHALQGLPSLGFSARFSTSIVANAVSFPLSTAETAQKLRDLGLDEAFISSIESATDSLLLESAWQKIHLLMEEGMSVQQINIFLKKCKLSSNRNFIHVSLDRVAAALHLFKSVAIEREKVGKVLIKQPNILTLRLERFESKFMFLQGLGLARKDIGVILAAQTRTFTFSIERWKRQLSFWQILGLGNETICKMIKVSPWILACDRKVETFITHFEMYGISKEDIVRIVSRHSLCLSLSMENLSQKIDFLQQLGFERNSKGMLLAYCTVASHSLELLQSRVGWLTSWGFSMDEARLLVRKCPRILIKRPENSARTLDYLLNDMKRDMKEILFCPNCLIYSLDNRIKPRFAVLAEKEVEHKLIALSTMLRNSEAKFLKRVALMKEKSNKNCLES